MITDAPTVVIKITPPKGLQGYYNNNKSAKQSRSERTSVDQNLHTKLLPTLRTHHKLAVDVK